MEADDASPRHRARRIRDWVVRSRWCRLRETLRLHLSLALSESGRADGLAGLFGYLDDSGMMEASLGSDGVEMDAAFRSCADHLEFVSAHGFIRDQ